MSFKPPKELVDPDRTQMAKKTRKQEWFWVYKADHIHWLDVVTPHHRVRSRGPGKALSPDGELKIVHVYRSVSV
jgi:hypothetical protein